MDLNATKGKGAGKGKGKGKGKDQKGGKDKGKGKGGQAYQGKGVSAAGTGVGTSPNFTGCFICGGKHYARDCPKRAATPQMGVEPCPAGAITTLCALRTCECEPESRMPESPGASGVGDKGVSTHNMFGALREEEQEEEPCLLYTSPSPRDRG